MTEAERIEVLREFLDTPVLGVPLIWYVGAVFIVCMACLGWLAATGYRKKRNP